MKVTHICLAGPVTDGWNYQDNLLTKYQEKLGMMYQLLRPSGFGPKKESWGNAKSMTM